MGFDVIAFAPVRWFNRNHIDSRRPGVSIEKISVRQVKAARALLAWSQEDLAGASGVSIPTIARLESLDGVIGGRSATVAAIRDALEEAGIEFIEADGRGAGVRLTPRHDREKEPADF